MNRNVNRRQYLSISIGVGASAILGANFAFGSDPPAAVSRGDGKVVCGLGKEFHAGRRAALLEKIKDGVILFRGLPEPRDYSRFYQDKVFWYFTGISSQDVTLVMDGRTGETLLFLPKKDSFHESWNGEMWDNSDSWISEVSGFTDIRPAADLDKELKRLLENKPPVYINKGPWLTLAGGSDVAAPHDRRNKSHFLDGRPTREQALAEKLAERYGCEVKNAASEIAALRQIKQPVEIDAMKRAAEIGALAFVEAMKSTKPNQKEYEIEALMSFVHERHGAYGPAYNAIVGSGPNNCILHYFASNRTMLDGELVLVDYAPDVDYYASDITRTWPINGKFSARQLELYNIVMESQAAGIAAAKPGNTMQDVALATQQVFEKHKVSHMVRHAPNHFIGLEVHDVATTSKLAPGMALAIEPGLYDENENIGIRIEDVVVVTEDGCEPISRTIPVEPEKIEALIAELGMLEK